MLRNTTAALVAVIGLGAAAPAFAHDVWIVPQKRDGALVAQLLYADPSRLELADYHKIVSFELITPTGKVNLKRPLTASLPNRPPALETRPFTAPAGSILAVSYDNGYYAVDPADKVESNTSKLLIPNASESWWVPKFGKTLLGPGSYSIKANTIIEIVPLNDPYAGGKLSVRVELRGKPLAGVKVSYGDGVTPVLEKDMPTVTTDKDGVASIDMARKGSYLLMASTLTPPAKPDLSDKDEVYATLAFNTAP